MNGPGWGEFSNTQYNYRDAEKRSPGERGYTQPIGWAPRDAFTSRVCPKCGGKLWPVSGSGPGHLYCEDCGIEVATVGASPAQP